MTPKLPEEIVNKAKEYLKNYTPVFNKHKPKGAYSLHDIALMCGISYYSTWKIYRSINPDKLARHKESAVKPGMFDVHEFSNWVSGEKEFRREAV